MPILLGGFGNFLIPLMIGCDDMVFPRLNRLSFQLFLLSALVIIASLHVPGGGFGGAWTAYPPLSAEDKYSLTPLGSSLWVTAVGLEFVAFLMGGINFVTTTMNARAKGMRMFDIPLVCWMIVIARIIFMLSVPPMILVGLGSYFYLLVRRARRLDPERADPQLSVLNQPLTPERRKQLEDLAHAP